MPYLFLLPALLLLVSCQQQKSTNSLKTDYISSLPQKQDIPLSKPSRMPLAKQNPPLPSEFRQRVSVNISDRVPLKQALTTLCQEAGLNLYIDATITKGLHFHTKDTPVEAVIREICHSSGLRYEFIGKTVRIESDSAYPQTYNLQFLNLARLSDNQVAIATNIFSSDNSSQDFHNNGSHSKITAKGETNFWSEVQTNLEALVGSTPDSSTKIAIHRQGGLVIVNATQRQHQIIQKYFEALRQSVATQVLIEAKVIEVSLKEEYKAGINWKFLNDGKVTFDLPFARYTQIAQHGSPLSGQQDMLSFGVRVGDFSILIQALQQFGACKTLSSPRLTVLNNHTAILKVAQNQVYFRLHYDKQYNLSVDRESVSVKSDIQTLPIGLVMSVHPSIDAATSKIILALRPTISRLARSVHDPAVDIAYGNQTTNRPLKPSLIPVVEVREIDSILELESGVTVVLGGLMETRNGDEKSKIPLLGDIPGVGSLFSSTTKSEEVVELVILLKATIMNHPT